MKLAWFWYATDKNYLRSNKFHQLFFSSDFFFSNQQKIKNWSIDKSILIDINRMERFDRKDSVWTKYLAGHDFISIISIWWNRKTSFWFHLNSRQCSSLIEYSFHFFTSQFPNANTSKMESWFQICVNSSVLLLGMLRTSVLNFPPWKKYSRPKFTFLTIFRNTTFSKQTFFVWKNILENNDLNVSTWNFFFTQATFVYWSWNSHLKNEFKFKSDKRNFYWKKCGFIKIDSHRTCSTKMSRLWTKKCSKCNNSILCEKLIRWIINTDFEFIRWNV